VEGFSAKVSGWALVTGRGVWPRGILLSAAFAEFGAKRAAEKAD